MANLRMPDGTVVSFPDDMPKDQIKAIISRKFPNVFPDATPAGQPPAAPGPGLSGVPIAPATGGPLPPAQGQGIGANVPPHTGQLLPISRDQTGAYNFDPNAGFLGIAQNIGRGAIDAASLPHDVFTGQTPITSDPSSVTDPSMVGRATNFAAFATPVSPATRGGLLGAKLPTSSIPAPTRQALYDASSAGYAKARNLGVVYTSKSVVDATAATQAAMEADGLLEENAPNTFKILGKLQSPPNDPTGAAPFTGIEAARQSLVRIARDNYGTAEAEAADRAIEGIDNFLARPDPASVVAGPASQVAQIAQDARGNWAAARRSSKLTNVETNAELRSFRSGNTSDRVRSRVAFLLDPDHPERLSGFTADEKAQLRQVNAGSASTKVLNTVGAMLGIAGAAAGAYIGKDVGGDLGMGVGASVGAASAPVPRMINNAITSRALGKVDEATRARSPLMADILQSPPTRGAGPTPGTIAAQSFVAGQLNDINARKQQALADALQNTVTY